MTHCMVCHGHVPAYFFFLARELRDRSLDSRTRGVVCGLVARPHVGFCLGRLAGKMSFFLFSSAILFCEIKLENFDGVFVDCYIVG